MKLHGLLMSVFFTFTMGFMLTIFFWANYPYKVIEFKESKTLKASYFQGETLSVKISHCKYMPLPARVAGQFVDGVVFTLKETTANSPVGCATRVALDITVPHELEPGVYVYRQTMQYKVNPLRIVAVVFETNKFNVVASSSADIHGD
jgi:hypothetical protein